MPENSLWAGKTLAELSLAPRFGIHVSSVLRGGKRHNIPNGTERIFPNDKLQIIGTDAQLAQLSRVVEQAVVPDDDRDFIDREMILRQVVLTRLSPFVGKKLSESRLREDYELLVVAIDQGQLNLTHVEPSHVFRHGDIVWMVGEKTSFERAGL